MSAAGGSGRPTSDPAAARLRDWLRGHRATDAREALSVAVMLAELERLDRPFDESADLTHVTASAIVVGPGGVILHRHRRLHRWLQPGGHIEPGETPEAAVLRECAEETGLPVTHPRTGPDLIHVDVHRASRDHVHLDLRYRVESPDLEPAPGPGESQDVAWFTWDEAMAMADDALVGALRTAHRLIGPPEAG